MAKMRAVQIAAAHGAFELVERDIPQPGAREVRIKVQACGVCHSDSVVKEGIMPTSYPRVPGHEVVGVIDALGKDVPRWKVGDRVGVGWNGGYCGYCDNCRRGDFFACTSGPFITGLTSDGGYADYMIARPEALALVPTDLSPEDAAPLMCAGVTTYNCLRNSGAIPGDLVAVLGIGGLGHLAVQYAAKSGYRTAAIARGADKAALAKQLGAHHYIDTEKEDPSKALQTLGGAKVILSTVTAADAMEATLGGLAIRGKFFLIGAVPSMKINPLQMLTFRQGVEGWYSGTSIDSQDTLNFSVLENVRSMNEVYPLEKAAEGYERMLSGKARFRVVLKTGN
ncbi:Alcohol dehydrogenase GroES-like protein [Candidatus Koribacter versatilis Ellin345]|uniref:Alcohol dehydrogenase GroES-like protein n=1 Tax=Koribacter versatilis (strain Ellin345) TaxID=204669 RepID=Q1IM55_KORVE|nr:alcohol dehydrogenase [Candidatus Koribacter versatilis]ABF42045.1 Alcohol dehydrogenase GroES-like protein [Candidatus Koribacter versatilis Ellin345]